MLLSVSDKTFVQEVLESSKVVLVSFWAPWCSLCQVADPLLSRLQLEWGDQLKLVRINADENLKLANDYRLTTLPTLLVFEEGQLRYRLDSFQGKNELMAVLERVISSAPRFEV